MTISVNDKACSNNYFMMSFLSIMRCYDAILLYFVILFYFLEKEAKLRKLE